MHTIDHAILSQNLIISLFNKVVFSVFSYKFIEFFASLLTQRKTAAILLHHSLAVARITKICMVEFTSNAKNPQINVRG